MRLFSCGILADIKLLWRGLPNYWEFWSAHRCGCPSFTIHMKGGWHKARAGAANREPLAGRGVALPPFEQ